MRCVVRDLGGGPPPAVRHCSPCLASCGPRRPCVVPSGGPSVGGGGGGVRQVGHRGGSSAEEGQGRERGEPVSCPSVAARSCRSPYAVTLVRLDWRVSDSHRTNGPGHATALPAPPRPPPVRVYQTASGPSVFLSLTGREACGVRRGCRV